ncbi:CPBP family intramembrane glutamic endopeptidase [Tuanshanicoccus lijuaniae]|uniref:CPBP family intramembrane glutamic endopeptidase n=1 Tax=Aerococcaceae bacterium zg-1292 TaxID=2774330 RepID=UPI001BD89E9A|nr:CPBP family intramembrane metalloprotease [Aerococcaceae bacterium zg-A91]MBS4457434.1 CPBP family intramembrane metalloprotease [Aerococcaceae bacterium zg-BR33]
MTSFIEFKKQSKRNFRWWSAPFIGAALLIIGEILSEIIWIPVLFLSSAPSQYVELLLQLFSFAFISLTVLVWARKVEHSPWQGLGIFKERALSQFAKGWGWGALLMTSCVLLMWLLGAVKFTHFNFSHELWLKLIPLLLAWSIQGTTEELLCRGWLLSSIGARHNVPLAVIISAFFFTALHLGNHSIDLLPLIDLFLFGILAALIMLKTNNIWLISGIHAAWNCFQGNIFAFPVSGTQTGDAFIHVSLHGPQWLSGGAFGVEGSIVSIILLLCVISWLCYDLMDK